MLCHWPASVAWHYARTFSEEVGGFQTLPLADKLLHICVCSLAIWTKLILLILPCDGYFFPVLVFHFLNHNPLHPISAALPTVISLVKIAVGTGMGSHAMAHCDFH